MEALLLAADIGGTKTNAGFYSADESRRPIIERSYRNTDFDSPETLLRQLMEDTGHAAEIACLAVAGAVRNGHCDMPNLGWRIDAPMLENALGMRRVHLLNDLEATAHGIATLQPNQLVTIQEGRADHDGNRALIAAGTGLGEALLIQTPYGMHVAASEGGHADFAPKDETQVALWRHLRDRYGHVSWERVVSGNGLKHIYDFLLHDMHLDEPPWLRARFAQGQDPAAIITESALGKTSDTAMQTLDIFMCAYGAAAGNLALKTLATGGIYIGGGIAPKILPAFFEGAFLRAFHDKGRYTPMMAGIPVHVILEPKAALHGAAVYLDHLHERSMDYGA